MFRYLAIRLFGTSVVRRPVDVITGAATVLDGDTIVVAGQRVRLHGIDAPEIGQTFTWRERQLASGEMALAALETLTAGVTLRCEVVDHDPYGRLVAKCYSPNGIDIGRRMVASGWALAYRRYSMDYVGAENQARRAKRGMWRGTFVKPWQWRAERPATSAPVRRVLGTRV